MFRDRAILLLALGQTLIWAGTFYIFPALLLRWEHDLGWSKAELTLAIALAVLASAGASPLAGRVIDRGHGPALLAGSALLGGLGVLALSAVASVPQFYAAWLAIGVAMAGCLYEPCFALVTRARGAEAKRGIIAITLIAGFASTISYPMVYSLSEALGWRGACVAIAAMVCLVAAPILWTGASLVERGGRERIVAARPRGAGRRGFLANPAFWCLGAGMTFIALSHGATLHHLLPILGERGISQEMSVLAASFIGPMQVAGRLAMMVSERHLSHRGVALTAFVMMALSIVMLRFSGVSPGFISAFVILFGSAYGTVSILRPLLTRDILGDEDFGAKSGALALPFLTGAALAPFLGSLIWGWGGYDAMLSVLVGCLGVGAVFYLAADRIAARQHGSWF